MATSMSVTDVEDKYVGDNFDVGDGFDRLRHQLLLFHHYRRAPTFKKYHQYHNSVTNNRKLSLT